MGPHGLALAAASGARPSGSKVNGAVGLTALAQHIVVVAGNRLEREEKGAVCALCLGLGKTPRAKPGSRLAF